LMLKIDLHVHTWYSDSTGSVDDVLAAARRKGLDGVAVTDHGTLQGAYEALAKSRRLIVLVGEEVKTTQGELLALGIRKKIPKNLLMAEAIARTHAQGGLAIIPHPTIPLFSRLREGDLRNLAIDGLEVISAITPMPRYFLKKNLELAQRLKTSITAGSDSHSPDTVGDAYAVVNSESRDPGDIVRAVKYGNVLIGGGSSKTSIKLGVVKGLLTHILLRPFADSSNH